MIVRCWKSIEKGMEGGFGGSGCVDRRRCIRSKTGDLRVVGEGLCLDRSMTMRQLK